MNETIRFIGLDVHKSSTHVAVAERDGEVWSYGKIETSRASLAKMARKLSRDGQRLCFCYEAGPLGYGPHRWLLEMGHECDVVAPSLIPQRPGDRVKTDRRDALKLARLTGTLPQNVNFAISEVTARAFLDANNVPYEVEPSDKPLPTADIAAKARDFTVRVECWK